METIEYYKRKYPDVNVETETSSIDIFYKFIDQIAQYKPNICLSGGEPLFYKGWYEIAKFVKSKKLYLSLQTNGTLIKDFADKIVETVDNLAIGLNSYKEDIEDKIREKGTFRKILEGIDEINRIEPKNKNLKIEIWTVIMEENYGNLEEFIEFAKNLNIDKISFRHFNFTDEDIINSHQKEFLNRFNVDWKFWPRMVYKPKIDTKSLTEQIDKIKNKKYKDMEIEIFPDFTEEEIINYYNDAKFLSKRFRKCISPYSDITLQPDGRLEVCPNYTIGNIKEGNFKTLWNNEKARKFRESILKDGILPFCRCCYGVYIS